jgi:transcriptional regulator with XRE-family HTH domain
VVEGNRAVCYDDLRKGLSGLNIEDRIQELRKRKGLSQEQLADVLGVSRQAVSKWESGQSLPEIEKLIAMSALFEATVDYILKGEGPPWQSEKRQAARLGSQIVSAVAAMLLAVAVIAALGQIGDETYTMDIYGGLVIESVGVMLLLIGIFLAGGQVLNKPLFMVNVLLAGILPSLFIAQQFLGFYPRPLPALSLAPILIFGGFYLLICATAIYFAILRKRA